MDSVDLFKSLSGNRQDKNLIESSGIIIKALYNTCVIV